MGRIGIVHPTDFARDFSDSGATALQTFLKHALLVVFGVLVGVTAGELILRAIGFGQLTPRMSFGVRAKQALEGGYLTPDPTLFWKARRDVRRRSQRAAHVVHPDIGIAPRGMRKRLVVLGDSCSRLVSSGLPYPAFLQAELGKDGWEILNASVAGYSSYQGLLWLRLQLLDADPDVVVVYFGWNDHWRTPGRTDRQYERSIQPSRLRLLGLLSRRPDPPPFRVPLEEYRENLQSIIDEVSRTGGRVVLVAAPYRFSEKNEQRYVANAYLLPDDEAVSLHRSYLDVVREFIGREGVTVLGADAVFSALSDTPSLFRDDGIHFTNEGHRVMAALLAEQILSGAGLEGTAAPELLEAARRSLAQPISLQPTSG
jgi:lysophospholipase L1-like esterase